MSNATMPAAADRYITEAIAPVVTLAMKVRDPNFAAQCSDDLQKQFRDAFRLMERAFFEQQLDAGDVEEIKFALSAFSDEIVMSSQWPGRFDWMAQPLQLEFFGESNGGERFFERLLTLREKGDQASLVALEAYYLCLLLGFQGKFAFDGQDRLMSIKASMKSELSKRKGAVNRQLSDKAVPENSISYRIAGQQPYWVIVAVFAFVLIGMTVFYSSSTQTLIANSASEIEQLHQQLNSESTR
ncbi:DotU family type IV/VI secretion system protein [Salinibius halmophilus]|uniref:DotU family type IV/VI secretion system protein n=1 Tax=Salinibius halmophilus TaxID=1853216 RepID=UPI000E664DAD|nr:DotU family type IV/VI secretion system protein [Salinibius halmophilus]